MTNVKYLVLLIILYLLSGCSEETLINYIDPPAPEERAQGVIKIKAEDYTPEVSILMLQDGESDDILFDANQRGFMSMLHCKSLSTKNKNCLSASSVPDRLRV